MLLFSGLKHITEPVNLLLLLNLLEVLVGILRKSGKLSGKFLRDKRLVAVSCGEHLDK
jgi:hypothetical protein